MRKPAPDLPVAGPGERIFLLDVPFREPAPGTVHVKKWKARVWVGAVLPAELRRYASRPYTYERFVEDDINGSPGPQPQGVAAKVPRPEQVEGARALAHAAAAGNRMFLCSDDPGGGKTILLILGIRAAAQLRGARSVLVVADRPAAITIPHWCQSIASVGDGGLRWLVTTVDRLKDLQAMNGRPRWRFDLVIGDEVHAFRHQSAARTQRWWSVARYLEPHDGAPFVALATATPGHHPGELTYLAPMLAQKFGQPTKDWQDFGAALTARGLHLMPGPYGTTTWNDQAREEPRIQQADIIRVREWMTRSEPPTMIHRAAPWGPVPLELLPVSLTADQRRAYEAEWGEFQTEMKLARRGSDVARGRAALLRFRQKAGLVRVPTTVEWVTAQVEAGLQVLVSTEFVTTAAEPIWASLSAAGVPVARIYGQGLVDVEAERLRFQRGQAAVMVTTVTASISLHANEQFADGTRASPTPRVGLFHQTRFSGLAGRQITGRTHRDYQVSPWWIAYAQDTAEEPVATTMVMRLLATSESVGGDTEALRRIAASLGADWLPEQALTAS